MIRTYLLAAALVAGGTGIAAAQNASVFDPNQLPAIHGKVAAYSLTPRGDVDGLILSDGEQIHLPPGLGTQLVYTVKPGDTVTVHGLKARAIPMVQAMSVTNDATGKTVADTGLAGPPRPGRGEQFLSVHGKVREALYGPRGEPNGALLEDGTMIHLPPPEARRLASDLKPGTMLYVRGEGVAGPLGRSIAAREIGTSPNQMTHIAAPPPPPHWRGHHPPPPHGPGAFPPPGGPGAPHGG